MTRSLTYALALTLACGLLGPDPARAQAVATPVDPSENARFRFGPLSLTPFLSLTELGVDTNVYNELDEPRQDKTATLGPGANYWLRLGRSEVQGKSELTYSWFQQYDDQRSVNTNNELRWVFFRGGRISPFLTGVFNRGRRRPNFEIDARSYRTENAAGGGADLRVSAKTTLRFEGRSGQLKFRSDEFFDGASLEEQLNHRTTIAGGSLREALTPLTTFIVKTEYETNVFEFTPVRDATGFRIMPGFEFDPLALIGGKMFVGYRRFNAKDPLVADYTGLVADVEANYRLRATRFDVHLARDVAYSYQITEPYYVLTDSTLRVLQKITHRWDVQGTVGRQWLAYRGIELGADVSTPQRTDRGSRLGGGIGYQVGEAVRIGMNVDYLRRTSPSDISREYDGLRIGGSFTYGLQRQ